ncbi:MAG: hypothetical protein A3D28_04695 [Omnitrophica bacterium RIFCSPHIGHO2_02_FULL_63_14]|nr:MAG: hypothetical protein A3D28_04695 [Omnitrophica bacterium RIFCSPHIGHO2_02_FULL_63_14]
MTTCCEAPKKRRVSLSVWAALAVCVLLAASFAWPRLEPFRQNVWFYVRQIWWAIILGFLLGGLIDRYVPREYVSRLLAARRKRTVFLAVSLGLAMSACSHGIIALAMELYKKGASTAVVVAFLLASPWANLPVTFMLIGFFGIVKALYIIVSALAVAAATGLLFQLLEHRGMVETNPHTLELHPEYSVLADIRRRWGARRLTLGTLKEDSRAVLKGAGQLADMVLGWILIGIALSGLAAAFIPPHLFHRFLGPNLPGLLTTLGLATVMEVCSEGTAPLAFEIYKQTAAFGNAFVFLMAGVITDLTELGLLWTNIGRRTAVWVPLLAVPQVVALGILANRLFR